MSDPVEIIVFVFCAFIAMLAALTLSFWLTGCATTRQFNSDDIQDGPCYSSYGGQRGYCDRGVSR